MTAEINEASGTPYFSFKDIDENKPSGSIKIRVETIGYFLKCDQERLEAGAALTAGGSRREVPIAGSPIRQNEWVKVTDEIEVVAGLVEES